MNEDTSTNEIVETEETTEPQETNVEETDTPVEQTDEEKEIDRLMNMSDEEFQEHFRKELAAQKEKDNEVQEKHKDSIPEPEQGQDDIPKEKNVKETKENKQEAPKSTEGKGRDTGINYKEEYERILRPFKANGKEITPRSIDDVVSLMQMGANYSKKMAAIKDVKRIAQTLDNAGIKEDDLNFLIDLHKGDSEAIKQLVKKHNIDPIEMDMDSISYNPKSHMVSSNAVDMNDAIDELKDSPHFNRMTDVLFKEWDVESKNQILANRGLLEGLHAEFESGRFDEIQKIVEYERMMGRLNGMNDMQAYINVQGNLIKQQQSAPRPQPVQQTSKRQSDPTVNKAKAAPVRAKSPAEQKTNITPRDILSMSDEEFEKLKAKKLF